MFKQSKKPYMVSSSLCPTSFFDVWICTICMTVTKEEGKDKGVFRTGRALEAAKRVSKATTRV